MTSYREIERLARSLLTMKIGQSILYRHPDYDLHIVKTKPIEEKGKARLVIIDESLENNRLQDGTN